MIVGCMGLGLEFSLCICLEGASRTLLQFFLQLCGSLPTLEAFLYRVQYLLVDPLFCVFISGASPRQFMQLVDFVVNHPNFCLGHPWMNEAHGRGFPLQISFRGGLPLALVNSPVVFLLPCGCGMGEHSM